MKKESADEIIRRKKVALSIFSNFLSSLHGTLLIHTNFTIACKAQNSLTISNLTSH